MAAVAPQRDRLISGLLDAGWPDKRIRAAGKVGATTFRALKAQYLRAANDQISGYGQITPDPPKTSICDVWSWSGETLNTGLDSPAHRVVENWMAVGADLLVAELVSP